MKHTIRNSHQRGAALVVGLILLAIITLLAVVGMNVSNSELQQATTEQLRLRAFQAAETGIEYGMPEIFKVSSNKVGTSRVSDVTGVAGSPISPADSKPMDTYKTTVTYRGSAGQAPGYGQSFSGFHYSVLSEGGSARNSQAKHEVGAYIVNMTSGQDSFTQETF
jgi:Tfp pilus assembly protein PilX